MSLSQEQSAAIEGHLPALRRYARALTQDASEADDLVQDCLVRAISRFHRYQENTNLRAWLFTILINLRRDAFRQRQRHGVTVDIDTCAGELRVDGGQFARIRMIEFMEDFRQLSNHDQIVLLLIGMEGFTYEEVSCILGVRVGTVKSRVSRARARLRNLQTSQEDQGTQDLKDFSNIADWRGGTILSPLYEA